ncbi:hypothetical protein [Brochothrix thermosphacta]|uniref:Uncharacterized protein n=1 Tax=Brochothrix thermosphacta TaxID=2756 RepID=A0A1D2LHS6_BROTH|nr:hypothetical protein [Brochothrix thermosphacta]SLM94218.1 hypothetical protein FM106_07705 [Brachybacterium faecium]ANZ94215.1 hypothetical protein BFC19_01585 [Brochothrix thermosphacta]ATF26930.1 hypothetical protein CNY62_11495 [Brochothrix thermosphacta]ATH86287.1 hypothetical protein CPF12_11175 [Brochothrix thermosphacta]ODJ64711.1 hypothetical protein BFR36_10115 [Brochothrix thermosphacta]
MKGLWLSGLITFTVIISAETFFTIPTENPQRVFFFIGVFVVIVILHLVITALINNIKKKNTSYNVVFSCSNNNTAYFVALYSDI